VIDGCVQQWGEEGRSTSPAAWLEEGLPGRSRRPRRPPGWLRHAGGQLRSNPDRRRVTNDVAIGGGVEPHGQAIFAAAAQVMGEWGQTILERRDGALTT